MKKIVWEELCEAVFYENYLAEYISYKKNKLKYLEIISIVFTFGSIIGLWKYPNKYWAVLLMFIQLVHYFRGKFIISEKQLILLEVTSMHYLEQRIELEKLAYDILNEKISESATNKKFREIQKKDTFIKNKYNHDKVKDINKINIIASKRKDDYLKRFID